MKPHVLYVGPFALCTGYAQAGHDYLLALHRAGVSLEIQPMVECDTNDLEERYVELLPLVRGYGDHQWAKRPTHLIVHTVPAHAHRFLGLAPPEAMRIAITTWETSQLPFELAELLGKFDKVVVPSEFCAASMAMLGEKLRIIPHCFDPEHWPMKEPDRGARWLADSPYVFYSILGWSERKNPIGLLKAYYASFTSADRVLLLLKVSSYSAEDMQALEAATGVSDLPPVEIVTDYLDHEGMLAFHRAGDCFVTAARGEGWNLPLFEATLLNKTRITTQFGGQMEYLNNSGNWYDVPCQLTPVITPPTTHEFIDGAGVRVVRQNAPSGITVRQRWAEPDLHVMGSIMRDVYVMRRRGPGVFDRSHLEERFGYGSVAAQFIELLNEDPTHADRTTEQAHR